VALAVKMQGPRSLGEAYALAKIQEEYLATCKRSQRPHYDANMGNWSQQNQSQGSEKVENKGYQSRQPNPRPLMAIQILTPMQMSERRKKGLCYHCDKKWSVGHKCKTMKLYIMEKC
jgi:hypothetical protein